VGWLIQLTTFNLGLDHEIFIRLSGVILAIINSVVLWQIVRQLGGAKSAGIALLLYNGSVYASVIAGVFIMPDTAMLTFLLLAYRSLLALVLNEGNSIRHWVGFGAFMGLSIMSKVHAGFLWLGFLLFILAYRPNWLLRWKLYLAGFITCLFVIPIIYWNVENEFASFTFHGNRLAGGGGGVQISFFLQELLGSVAYNNPINFFLIWITIVALFRKKKVSNYTVDGLYLYTGLPLILIFLAISLFKQTLPHWSAPAYTLMIIPASVYLRTRMRSVFAWASASYGIVCLLMVIGAFLINNIHFGPREVVDEKLGRSDFTLDMSCWKQMGQLFAEVHEEAIKKKLTDSATPIVITRWFPGAHIDWYIGRPNRLNVVSVGDIDRLHKYHWIAEEEGLEFEPGKVHYYLTTSHLFGDVEKIAAFRTSILLSKVPVYKDGDLVEFLFVYLVQ
jgi:4-amino-4-deoxy-L-arabinose transferase-like glycosyltransferase